jgi:hypothetical protein
MRIKLEDIYTRVERNRGQEEILACGGHVARRLKKAGVWIITIRPTAARHRYLISLLVFLLVERPPQGVQLFYQNCRVIAKSYPASPIDDLEQYKGTEKYDMLNFELLVHNSVELTMGNH